MTIRYEYVETPEGKKRLEEAFDVLFTETFRRMQEKKHHADN